MKGVKVAEPQLQPFQQPAIEMVDPIAVPPAFDTQITIGVMDEKEEDITGRMPARFWVNYARQRDASMADTLATNVRYKETAYKQKPSVFSARVPVTATIPDDLLEML